MTLFFFYYFQQRGEARYQRQQQRPEQNQNSWRKWCVFFPCRGRKVRLVGPPHITHLGPWPLSNALPIAGPARPGPPITSGPKDPVRFLSPCSKCTSGSHLTPVHPNFHFRGRCGFQIIYHFPKCFHMCAAFPSAAGPCLRPTFSKCIKIQFAPKKFRHWCFIVVMSGNY